MGGKALITAIVTTAMLLPVSADAKKNSTPAPISNIEQLQERLGAINSYAASAKYCILLPSAETEVIYNIELQSLPAPDAITPCNYFITWHKASQPEKSFGFAACSDGNYFRYADERLREYHSATDTLTTNTTDGGAQSTARFTDLLPAFMLREVNRIVSDSAYTYRFNSEAVYAGVKAVRLEAVETVKGYDVRQLSYTFEAVSGAPLHVAIENNPDTQYEQSVTVDYAAPGTDLLDNFSEVALSALYPDIFNRLRERDLRVDNLAGTAMPQFSCPTLAGDRYTYRRGEPFQRPALIAVIDPNATSTAADIEAVRRACGSTTAPIDIIWAVNSRHTDTIETLFSPANGNETILIGANSIIKNCGITDLPTIILVNNEGIIKSAGTAANKNLTEIVIQMTESL